MPIRWHLTIFAVVGLWMLVVMVLAPVIPLEGGTLGFIGTILTLLPAAHEMSRRFYFRTRSPAAPADDEQQKLLSWLRGRIENSMAAFNLLYALSLCIGISMIAIGFLR